MRDLQVKETEIAWAQTEKLIKMVRTHIRIRAKIIFLLLWYLKWIKYCKEVRL